MTHAVLVQSKVAAKNVDAMNRPAIGTADLDNGNVIQLLTESAVSGQTEVWSATIPSASAGLKNLWMVYEPEVVLTVSGTKQYKGIDPDPQDFYIPSGMVFSAFQPELGDIILLTGDGITGSKASNGFIVATASDYKLNWAAAAVSGLSYALIGTSYISIGSGAIDSQRVTAYKFECVALA